MRGLPAWPPCRAARLARGRRRRDHDAVSFWLCKARWSVRQRQCAGANVGLQGGARDTTAAMPREVGAAAMCLQPASPTSPYRAPHRADEGGATAVWPAGTRPSSASVRPGCLWSDQPVCSCARAVACRWCCAATATAATAIAAARAGGCLGMRPGATPRSVTSLRGAVAVRTPSDPGAGGSGVPNATPVMVMAASAHRT